MDGDLDSPGNGGWGGSDGKLRFLIRRGVGSVRPISTALRGDCGPKEGGMVLCGSLYESGFVVA
jgi:hypothetical protein